MSTKSSNSNDDLKLDHPPKLFGRQRPLHAVFGGGRVADILLWRNMKLSAGIVGGLTFIWFLIEVVQYNFLTLLCHILLFTMFSIFLLFQVAALFSWSPPDMHKLELSESIFRSFLAEVNRFLLKFFEISSGKDWKLFGLAITSLWMLSIIGTYFSPLNLLYVVVLGMEVLLPLYERHEKEVDNLAVKGYQEAKKLFKQFGSTVLDKIPMGQVKEKNF